MMQGTHYVVACCTQIQITYQSLINTLRCMCMKTGTDFRIRNANMLPSIYKSPPLLQAVRQKLTRCGAESQQ